MVHNKDQWPAAAVLTVADDMGGADDGNSQVTGTALEVTTAVTMVGDNQEV